MNHYGYTEQQLVEIIYYIEINGLAKKLAKYNMRGFYLYWRRKLIEKVMEYRDMKIYGNIYIDELLAENQRLKVLFAELMLKNQVLISV